MRRKRTPIKIPYESHKTSHIQTHIFPKTRFFLTRTKTAQIPKKYRTSPSCPKKACKITLRKPAVQCSKWVMFFWLAPKMMFLRRFRQACEKLRETSEHLQDGPPAVSDASCTQTVPSRLLSSIHNMYTRAAAVNWDYLLPLSESSYSNAPLNFPSHDLGSLPSNCGLTIVSSSAGDLQQVPCSMSLLGWDC